MAPSPSYDCLIVDPRTDSRQRLKLLLNETKNCSSITTATSLADGLHQIEEGDGVHIVFVTRRFEIESLENFVRLAQQRQNSKDAAYILLLENDASTVNSIAGNLLTGFDGLLLEPYSLQSLQDIIQIAAKVRKEHRDVRLKLAMRLLVAELAAQHSEVVLARKGNRSGRISEHLLHEMASVLKELDEEARQLYFEAVMNYYLEVPAPQAVLQKPRAYRGVSERVRARSSQRALEALKKAMGS